MDQSVLFLVGASGLSVAGWMLFRNSLRDEVERALRDDYAYDRTLAQASGVAAVFGGRIAMPTSREFAESFVPIWSTNSPQEAIEDVLAKGRASTYWPAKYRDQAPSSTEKLVFDILNSLYLSSKQQKQMAQGNAR